jgi:hypothetical protein
MHGERTRETPVTLEHVWEHVQQLERVVEQVALIQARQIDRERNVPGSDPAELDAIDVDLAAVRGITHKLVEMQQGNVFRT